MNSLNLISSRVIGQSNTPSRPRSRSYGDGLKREHADDEPRGRSFSAELVAQLKKDSQGLFTDSLSAEPVDDTDAPIKSEDEKQPLLGPDSKDGDGTSTSGYPLWIKKLANAMAAVLVAIGAPVVYVARCFRDQDGKFTMRPRWPRRSKLAAASVGKAPGLYKAQQREYSVSEKPTHRVLQETKLKHSYSSESIETMTSDSDLERRSKTRSKTKREKPLREESESRRSSIRIKEQNDPAMKRRRQKKGTSPLAESTPLTVDNIKSPRSPSPSLKITKYPHAPQPPRPLIPRRQPSYANVIPRSPPRHGQPLQQKTLVLDLDETLIHSLAKGGRMSSGHMVEVKLNAPVALAPPAPGQAPPVIGPQHPILYYVHKRPHCDEFLRKVAKWYKLVVFTASVQEYADPVIDWLEQERKYFVGRYYRQHCTFRNGAYIKDLSSIEPDLSKVIILDNSPVSYIFHEGESSFS
jgi:CTD nuclear envelope phosphatase 1